MKQKYSLFIIEKRYETDNTAIGSYLTTNCFEYVDTFDTLEEAYDNSVHILEKTLIIPSYESTK
jgi:hypothetical protein